MFNKKGKTMLSKKKKWILMDTYNTLALAIIINYKLIVSAKT